MSAPTLAEQIAFVREEIMAWAEDVAMGGGTGVAALENLKNDPRLQYACKQVDMLTAILASLEGEPKLAPGIDTPTPLQMARWLDERAAVNFANAKRPPAQWESNVLPYIAVRLKQAAQIIRDLESFAASKRE